MLFSILSQLQLIVQSHQWKYMLNVWNMFKVHNKDDVIDLVLVFLLRILIRFHFDQIVDFEQVNTTCGM